MKKVKPPKSVLRRLAARAKAPQYLKLSLSDPIHYRTKGLTDALRDFEGAA